MFREFHEYDKIAKLNIPSNIFSPSKAWTDQKVEHWENVKIQNQNAAKFLHSKIVKLSCSKYNMFYSILSNIT